MTSNVRTRAASRAERLVRALRGSDLLLTEGALIERLRRDPGITLHPTIANASLLYTTSGAASLARLWRGYLDVGHAHGIPTLVCTPTWRANPERLAQTPWPDVRRVSRDAVALLSQIRRSYREYGDHIFLGGLMGCRGDAYKPREALDVAAAEQFHTTQADALARAGADFLIGATLPALSEALGMARAMVRTGIPYVLSFVLRPRGTLLDGTPVAEAIRAIDSGVGLQPAAYLANCVHPENFGRALEEGERMRPGLKERLVGVQGNTSRLSPEDLDGAAELDFDEPAAFGASAAALRARFGSHVLGGCCGTDERHIAAIAGQCAY